MADLEALEANLMAAIADAEDLPTLNEVRIAALGKKGSVSSLLKELGRLPEETRREQGVAVNDLKTRIAAALDDRQRMLEEAALAYRLQSETADVTQPVEPSALTLGRIHPVSQVSDELITIFADMGFALAEGPDIESEFYNFSALNIPDSHPARQMHDTFYFPPDKGENKDKNLDKNKSANKDKNKDASEDESEDGRLLRTHTSPVQIRAMQASPPPYRLIAPGRVYRCDSDQTHTPMFHQIEGLMVDEQTHMGHLKWVLETFLAAFFELDSVRLRLRPSYFPFTEPSMEVDVQCLRRDGELRIGEGDDWMEILGCGMVHPKVLTQIGLDADKYQGFAFGLGIDRLAMLKYGMADLRAFFDSDIRWLRHYGFSALNIPTLRAGLSRDEGI